MRHGPGRARLAAMKIATACQRVILDAAIDGSVIRGTLTASSGGRREFHGWLELNTALEAMLGIGSDHAHHNASATAGSVRPESQQAAERSDRIA
jgi:hypothetical protein